MQQRPALQMKQSQSLVMTQALQQSIKLLQLTSIELQEFVDQALDSNPFLADGEDGMEDTQADTPAEAEFSDSQEEKTPIAADAEVAPESDAPVEAWEYDPAERTTITSRNSDGDVLEAMESKAEDITLKEHLMQQAAVAFANATDKRIAIHLIDLVDEAGYVREDLNALSQQWGVEKEDVEAVLGRLQTFDPAGVCARDLPECLRLQLKALDRLDPAMEIFLQHMHLLADGNIEALKRKVGLDAEDLKDMIAEIRGLNPKPGMQFEHEIVQAVIPDVHVGRGVDGKWRVELNSASLPKVLVNKRYYAQVTAGRMNAVDKRFFSDQMAHANWLTKALDQRANTILKVATDLVAQQNNFFKLGIHHLKPLTLKDVAAATGYHESTVSRVTTGKYMMTPRGLFELKYFFTSGVGHSKGGDDVSSETVKFMIKELIDKEAPNAVLSDDDLADLLKAKNVNVARRTVAKYREALNVPSSMQRRRLKAARA